MENKEEAQEQIEEDFKKIILDRLTPYGKKIVGPITAEHLYYFVFKAHDPYLAVKNAMSYYYNDGNYFYVYSMVEYLRERGLGEFRNGNIKK